MRKFTIILSVALVLSTATNIFLFKRVVDWQEAWLEQIITTSNVEILYKTSGSDISFSAVRSLVGKELGDYEIVPISDKYNIAVGNDKEVILTHGTRLYFKDGQYVGSKANLPSHLEHWNLGQSEF